jgi:hypothetical protein
VVKSPTTIICPLEFILISYTVPLNPEPILNVLSLVPLAFNLAILFADTPFNDVNKPPTNILPSDCRHNV